MWGCGRYISLGTRGVTGGVLGVISLGTWYRRGSPKRDVFWGWKFGSQWWKNEGFSVVLTLVSSTISGLFNKQGEFASMDLRRVFGPGLLQFFCTAVHAIFFSHSLLFSFFIYFFISQPATGMLINRKRKQRSYNEAEKERLAWTAVHRNGQIRDY